MGGNAKAINCNDGSIKIVNRKEAYAQKINLTYENIDQFKNDLIETLLLIHKRIDKLWPNKECIENFSIFNGSSSNLFSLSNDEFLKYKTSINDVDIMIQEEYLDFLFESLLNNEGNLLGKFSYIGQNRQQLHGTQISSVWFHKDFGFVQIDFEGVKFENNKPNEFSKFARSSPWEDVKQGFKGIAHKYLLMMLAWNAHPNKDIVVLTDKSPLYPINKIRYKTLNQPINFLSFSVDKGLRQKLQIQYVHGSSLRLNNKIAHKEIPTNESVYITNVNEIFKILFHNNFIPNDIVQNMTSFVGLLRLCELYLTSDEIQEIFSNLIKYKLFGRGQALYRNNPDEDRSIKVKIFEKMICEFQFLEKLRSNVDLMMDEYYKCYNSSKEK